MRLHWHEEPPRPPHASARWPNCVGAWRCHLRQHGLPLGEGNFSCYAGHSVAHWALVCHGMGIGAMLDEVTRATPGMVRVLDDVPPVVVSIWLVTHRELRTARRIRVVFEALAQGLGGQ